MSWMEINVSWKGDTRVLKRRYTRVLEGDTRVLEGDTHALERDTRALEGDTHV